MFEIVRTLKTFRKCTWLNGPSSVLFSLNDFQTYTHSSSVTLTSFYFVPPSPSLLLKCLKQFSDWNSHTLTMNFKEDRCLISCANRTESQLLYTVVFNLSNGGFHRGSQCGWSIPTKKTLTGKMDKALPCSHGILTLDAYPCLEIYRAKWNFHTSQPVSLNTSVDSTSSFPVILKEGWVVIIV